jgi:hypothetical protein
VEWTPKIEDVLVNVESLSLGRVNAYLPTPLSRRALSWLTVMKRIYISRFAKASPQKRLERLMKAFCQQHFPGGKYHDTIPCFLGFLFLAFQKANQPKEEGNYNSPSCLHGECNDAC